MNYFKLMLPLLFVIAAFSACKSLTECNNISNSEALMLIDVSDSVLFKKSRQDINDNFGGFMQRSGLGVIQPCQRFTFRVASLDANETLNMSSKSIEITRKGQSVKDQQHQANPAPVLNMLKEKLSEFDNLSREKEATSGSTLANTLLKAIVQTDPASVITVIMFTDGIENNQYANLYNKIPSGEEVPGLLNTLIDARILEKWEHYLEEGGVPNLIVVLKQATLKNGKNNLRDIKNYWNVLFKALKIVNVEFVDNLENVNL